MRKLDLADRYKDFIISTVLSVLEDVEIFVYGSRVQGRAQEYSDVDIALKCPAEIDFQKILRLKSLFHDSTLPYKVDIVDLRTLNERFLNIIQPDLYKIN